MPAEQTHKTSDVFGIQRDVPKNYVPRVNVDDLFVTSLTVDKHVVVYGSSKQGKTSLRKYNLMPDDYISIMCSDAFDLPQLNSAILKQAGYTIEQSTSTTVSGGRKIHASIGGGINFAGNRIAGEVGLENSRNDQEEQNHTSLELDPGDVNDIIRALSEIGFTKLIVLEDFHYLPDETQRSFSVALKAFHEDSELTFVVVGVWLDENRLVQYNGDLTGRVVAVDADEWSDVELHEVVAAGEALLNVSIDEATVSNLIAGSFESVAIVQDACYRICVGEQIYSTQDEHVTVGTSINVQDLVKGIVAEHSARYRTFLEKFSDGFQETTLHMHRWLLLPVLMAAPEELEAGLRRSAIHKIINVNHPDSPVNPGNLTQALASTGTLQIRSGMKPFILDYDQSTRRLHIVDRGFLIWLNYQDRSDLREAIELPAAPTVPIDAEVSSTGFGL